MEKNQLQNSQNNVPLINPSKKRSMPEKLFKRLPIVKIEDREKRRVFF